MFRTLISLQKIGQQPEPAGKSLRALIGVGEPQRAGTAEAIECTGVEQQPALQRALEKTLRGGLRPGCLLYTSDAADEL